MEFVSSATIPTVKSFLVADSVFRQVGGKWCIIGVFDRIWTRSFPVLHPTLGLFLKIADAVGHHELAVEFQNAQGQALVERMKIEFEISSRRNEHGIGFQTSGLPIPAPGRYFFKLYFDGQLSTVDIPIDVGLVRSEV